MDDDGEVLVTYPLEEGGLVRSFALEGGVASSKSSGGFGSMTFILTGTIQVPCARGLLFTGTQTLVSGSSLTDVVSLEEEADKGIDIIKKPPGGVPDIVHLTMKVEPADAQNAGCTTDPRPTPPNAARSFAATPPTEASFQAVLLGDCAREGWNFKEWTGDFTGVDPTGSVTMDSDKTVVAHFEQPRLEVTLINGPFLVCPEEVSGKEEIITIIELTANDVSAWDVIDIKLDPIGNGLREEIDEAILEVREKTITQIIDGAGPLGPLTFVVGEEVAKSGKLDMILKYKFAAFPKRPGGGMCPLTLGENEKLREYGVKIKEDFVTATAKDVRQRNGKKFPEDFVSSNLRSIACVHNFTQIEGFNLIQPAIEAEVTQAGDDIVVCPGEYVENVTVSKPGLTLRSVAGSDSTTIRAVDITAGSTPTAVKIEKNGVNVRGFFLTGGEFGVHIVNASGSTIGVSTTNGGKQAGRNASQERNVISNNLFGIHIEATKGGAAGSNKVQGNYIGTDKDGNCALNAAGNCPLSNLTGVIISNASFNEIGGVTEDARNIISGNAQEGISIMDSTGNTAQHNRVRGNYIGLNAAGTEKLGNGSAGVRIFDASFNTIGGIEEGARNVISGNGEDGIHIHERRFGTVTRNQVLGNYVGLNAAGTDTLGNGRNGLFIESSNNTIGGVEEGARNVISGNGNIGLVLSGEGNKVLGNYIGLNAAGTEAFGNKKDGVLILDANGNTIGGTSPGAGNVISGNLRGILIQASPGEAAEGNTIQGNFIGTNKDGTCDLGSLAGCPLGNRFEGVRIQDAVGNTIGGDFMAPQAFTCRGACNVIAGNGPGRGEIFGNPEKQDGVAVVGTRTPPTQGENTIAGNFIGQGVNRMEVKNVGNGIFVKGLPRTRIQRNLIAFHIRTGLGGRALTFGGVRLERAGRTVLSQNLIDQNDVGLIVESSSNVEVRNGTFTDNSTCISVENSPNLFLGNSELRRCFLTSTGLHLIDSPGAVIQGNNLEDNAGAGVFLEGSSTATVTRNNFIGNPDFALRNDTGTPILAQGNFWGDASGPAGEGPGSGDPVSGDVDFSGFLTEPVAVVVTAAEDTLRVPVTAEDSVSVFLQNFVARDDVLDIAVEDDEGWLVGPAAFTVTLEDSLSAEALVRLRVPEGAGKAAAINQVRITATSRQNTAHTDADTLVIASFVPQLVRIDVAPDSLVIAPGQPLQVTAEGIHQFGGALAFTPQWSATAGAIDPDGLFTADSTDGEVVVTATDAASGLQGQVRLRVAAAPSVARLAVAPEAVTLEPGEPEQFFASAFDALGFTMASSPLWSTDGGEINQDGFFIAGDAAGTFTVTATDTTSGVQGHATVTITESTATATEDEAEVPNAFALDPNYPNPFNPTTTIPYQVPVASRVTVEVYDVLGRRVARLVEAEQAAGRYQVAWRADRLASGVYFVRLVAEVRSAAQRPFIAVRKVVLVK